MKILDWLKEKIFSRDRPQNRYYFSGAPFLFGKSISGATVNEVTALQVSVVYACVRILAESIAALPLHVYEYKDGGKERAINHPLYFILRAHSHDYNRFRKVLNRIYKNIDEKFAS